MKSFDYENSIVLRYEIRSYIRVKIRVFVSLVESLLESITRDCKLICYRQVPQRVQAYLPVLPQWRQLRPQTRTPRGHRGSLETTITDLHEIDTHVIQQQQRPAKYRSRASQCRNPCTAKRKARINRGAHRLFSSTILIRSGSKISRQR